MARKKAPPSVSNLPADQPFSGLEPGSLLRDFEMLLRAIEPGMPVSDKNGMPAGQTVRQLDAKLQRPMNLQLARWDLRWHPYLQGLYLLAQAGNFTVIEGKKVGLNPAVKASWDELNDTERYFNLLEALFVHADGSMVGQRASSYDLHRIPDNVARLPPQGETLDLEAAQFPPWLTGFGGEMMNLALADLFGLVTTEFANRPVKPWRPAVIRATAWGRAIAPVLRPRFDLERDDLMEMLLDAMSPRQGADWGVYQPIFSRVYPAYQRVLQATPVVSRREGVYVFKVSLGNVWRRIAFPDDYTLWGVLDEILAAFRFDNDHLHAFRFRDRGGRRHEYTSPECSEGPASDEMDLAELPIDPGMSMELEYDFGDSWRFNVKLERVEPVGAIRGKLPRVLEKEGKAPEQYPRWD